MYTSYKFVYQSVAIVLLLLSATAVHAQNDDALNTFTPYSFYGLGDLALPGTAYNQGMAGLGTGLRTTRQINFVNPAALTARDSLSFMIDFGLENQNYYSKSYSGNTEYNAASNSTSMHHIALTFPVTNYVAVGVGLFPYSHVGYDIRSVETDPEVIANAGNIYYNYKGEGGFSQIALSVGAKLGKRLSIGVGGQYYFGTIDRYSMVEFTSDASFSGLVTGRSLKAGNFGAVVGAQYEQPLKNDHFLTVGATYQFSTPITKRVIDFAYKTYPADTVEWKENNAAGMSIPQTIGVGFSLRKHDVWTVGADYVYQDWKDDAYLSASHQGRNFKVIPSHLLKVGGEWTPNRLNFRSYLSRCTYRVGFSYERTYMSFDGHQLKDLSATIGFGFPINRWNNNINVSLQAGRRGTTDNNLIRETYVKLSLSFSLYDIWFIKPRIE